MNKSCFDLSELVVTGSTGSTGIVGCHIGLLDIAFQCSLYINKITSWYQLFDCFEDLYYYFINSIADSLLRGSAQGISRHSSNDS